MLTFALMRNRGKISALLLTLFVWSVALGSASTYSYSSCSMNAPTKNCCSTQKKHSKCCNTITIDLKKETHFTSSIQNIKVFKAIAIQEIVDHSFKYNHLIKSHSKSINYVTDLYPPPLRIRLNQWRC